MAANVAVRTHTSTAIRRPHDRVTAILNLIDRALADSECQPTETQPTPAP